MEHKTKKSFETYGSGGWVEGKEEVKLDITKLISKSTGKSIFVYGHRTEKPTGIEIRERISTGYSKDYKREFLSKSNKFLEDDFE